MLRYNIILLNLIFLFFTIRSFGSENFVIHSVKDGDTLSEIATAYYGYKDMYMLIQTVNGIPDENRIAVGQKLVIPTSSNFFLRKFKIRDLMKKPVFYVYKNSNTSQVYVGTHIKTKAGEGNFRDNRFLLVSISEKPYEIVFDSHAFEQTYKNDDYLKLLDDWKIIDLDGDGDIDILAESIQGSDCYLTHYCFHLTDGKYVPYVVVKDVSIGEEYRYRDKKKLLVFRYQERYSEKQFIVKWADVRKKGPLTRK